MILTGTLLTPTGVPYKNSYVRLVAKTTSEQVLKGVTSGFTTDETGEYSIDCPFGDYSVVLSYPTGFQPIGSIVIDEDTTETNINALIILGQTAISNPLVKQVAADAASALASKDAAAVSATQAATSEQAVEDSLQAVQVIQTDITTKASEVQDNTTIASDAAADAELAKAVAEANAVAASVSASTALAVLGSVNIFPDTAAGITATDLTTNKYFSVPSPNSTTFLTLYLNSAGVAVQQGIYASKSYIDSLVGKYEASDSLVPLYVDSAMKVPVWLANGLLSATGISPELLEQIVQGVGLRGVIPTIDASSNLVPLYVDSAGKVPVWLADGMLAATGISPALLSTIQQSVGLRSVIPTIDSANSLVPLAVDSAGKVPVWLDEGLLSATGISPALVSTIAPNVANAINLSKVNSDSKTLYKYRASAAKLRAGSLSQPNVLLTGDSWTELSPISQAIADRLYSLFGKSGDGWVHTNAGTNTLNGITAVMSGVWTQYDASAGGLNGVPPTNGCGLDGRSITSVVATSRYVISQVTCTEVEIFYQDLNGTFQYRAYDGPDWQTVVCENSGTTKSVKLTGLVDNTPRIVEVRTTGNTGTVCIHGLYFTRSAVPGAILNKCGNSGSIAQNIAVYSDQIGYYASKINPDVVIIILGTNDYRIGVTISDYEAHLTTIINAYRSAVPGVAVILLAPAKTDGVATVPLVQFRDSMSKLAATQGCEFYSLYDEFSNYSEMNSLGMFADAFHLNSAGANFLAGRLCTKFLNDR